MPKILDLILSIFCEQKKTLLVFVSALVHAIETKNTNTTYYLCQEILPVYVKKFAFERFSSEIDLRITHKSLAIISRLLFLYLDESVYLAFC